MSTEMTGSQGGSQLQTQSQADAQTRSRPQQQATTPQRITWHTPPMDVFENADQFLVVADLPGVKKENLTVRVERQSLLVEGRGQGNVGWRRELALPDTIDTARISAELKNGVLTLVLPTAERAKPRTIEIKGA